MAGTHKSIHGDDRSLQRERERAEEPVPYEDYERLSRAFSGVVIGITVVWLFYFGLQLYKGFVFGQW